MAAIMYRDLIACGTASHSENDSTTEGGAIVEETRISWADQSGSANTLYAVSDSASDNDQVITATGLNAAGVVTTDTCTMTGNVPVKLDDTNGGVEFEIILKVDITSGTAAVGNIAVYFSSTGTADAIRDNTAQAAGTVDYVILDSGASGTDDLYLGHYLIMDSGSASGDVRSIVRYDGTTKRAYVDKVFSADPSSGDYRVHEGVVFSIYQASYKPTQVRSLFYDISAPDLGESTDYFYAMGAIWNAHATKTLTSAELTEELDANTIMEFAVEDAVDDTGTTANRKTTPASGFGAFASTDTAVPGNALAAGSYIKFCLKLTTAAGADPLHDKYRLGIKGKSTA